MNIINGNILDIKEGIIGHQVNCQMVMGAGLAKQIRVKYPRVFSEYIEIMGKTKVNRRLGICQMVEVLPGKLFIANLFGQFHYIPRGKPHTDYGALAMALRNMKRWSTEVLKKCDIYLPYGIGCGLAGGDWNIVEGIIRDSVPDAILVRYDQSI